MSGGERDEALRYAIDLVEREMQGTMGIPSEEFRRRLFDKLQRYHGELLNLLHGLSYENERR